MMTRAALEVLEQRFIAGLAQRVEALRATLADDGTRRTERLRLQFHSLAGIGGTFGFHNVSQVARAGEALCVDALGTPENPPNEPLLASTIEALSAISRSLSDGGPGQAADAVYQTLPRVLVTREQVSHVARTE